MKSFHVFVHSVDTAVAVVAEVTNREVFGTDDDTLGVSIVCARAGRLFVASMIVVVNFLLKRFFCRCHLSYI